MDENWPTQARQADIQKGRTLLGGGAQSMPLGNVPTPTRGPSITGQLEQQNAQLGALSQAINDLGLRLLPILGPHKDEQGPSPMPAHGVDRVVYVIEIHNETIRMLTAQVGQLINRLEL